MAKKLANGSDTLTKPSPAMLHQFLRVYPIIQTRGAIHLFLKFPTPIITEAARLTYQQIRNADPEAYIEFANSSPPTPICHPVFPRLDDPFIDNPCA